MLILLQISVELDVVRACLLTVAENTIFTILMRLALQMFLMPSVITMSIAATRMYRSLPDFGSSDMYDTASFPFLQELIVVSVAVAGMDRTVPQNA